ncbi:MAG: ABC transporter permease, partial [Bacteroidales bacterium]|nr:ABC transporter permease [Bacteroidales bacterium]
YRDKTGEVGAYMAGEGVHPPSPLSIFSRGLDSKMPYKVITSRDGNYKIEYAKPDNKKDMLGEIDFAFIVSFVLSILAIVFTFSAIAGDKESGVLRGILSNAVLRRQVLMAKLLGNYLVFLVPFLLSMLVALLVVYFSGIIPIFSAALFPATLAMIGISLVFLFALFNLGLWISALARNSILSINVLLLIWIVLGLVIPKISPVIGAVIYPVESTSVFESKKALLRVNILKEQSKEEIALFVELRTLLRPEATGISSGWDDITGAFDEKVIPIREKFEQQLISETDKLTSDYTMRCDQQNRIAKSIARLSPIHSVNNLMAEISATGYSEADNFLQQAGQFQATVKQEVYDQYNIKNYHSGDGSVSMQMTADGFDAQTVPIPAIDQYRHIPVGKVLQQNWVDIMLLCLYSLLFFVCGFISFLRFDVR